MTRQQLSLLLTTGAIGVMSALVLDSISSPDKIARYVGIPSPELVVPFLLVQAGLHLGWGIRFHPWFTRFVQWLALPALAVLTVVLTAIDANSPLNTVFSLTRLHQSRLGLVVVFLFFAWLLNQSKAWWQKHGRKVLFFFPLIVFLGALTVRFWPWTLFLELVKEDRLTENLQFLVLAGVSVWSATRAWHHFTQGKYLEMVLALVLALGFGAIAGDEVSWMQRHLEITTPEVLTEHNRQGEISFHNLYAVEWLVEYAYVSLGVFGVFSAFVARLILPKNWKHWSELFPSHLLMVYFAIPMLHVGYNIYKGGGQFPAWSEPTELALYSGLALWCAYLVTLPAKRYLNKVSPS